MLFHCAATLSRLSLQALYRLADGVLYPVMYHIVRYRRAVVEKNLRNSFPDKSEAERKRIEKAFYHQLCDTIVETIYGYRCSDAEMKQRVTFAPMDEVNRLVDAAGGGIFMLAHMGNWEWLASVQQWVSPGVKELNVYRTLKNKEADRLMLAIRAKRGGECVEKQRILREMVRYRAAHQPVTIGLIGDQKPRPQVTRTWVQFLHQETGFLDGGEMLGTKFGYPVFYAHITHPERGHYHCQFSVLAADPKACAPGQITEAYARALERNIVEEPHLWLWTHNRWKWQRNQQS